MDQSQEILLGHAIFASSEYRMTQLPSYCTLDEQYDTIKILLSESEALMAMTR